MSPYLRRLATTGAAYTASSVLSKLIAVALLPLYTRHLTPSDYGAAELILVGVIAAAIVIRLGLIEALLRFYYKAGEDPARVVRTAFASLLIGATVGVVILLPFASPISEALLGHSDPELARIGIFGLWVFTMYEFLLTLYRLDERARAFLIVTVSSVLVTIPVTIWLVVIQDDGARGLLLGQFVPGGLFVIGLIAVQRHRLSVVPDPPLLRRMVRFGFPTMPAELSLYSLSFIDRIIIVHYAGLAKAGLYALAVKFAQAVNVLVRGFQLAWPPLAYSIRDDEEARRAYAPIITWFVVACTFVVAAMWLFSTWIVRLLAAPEFYDAHEAIGLVSTGIMLYALYLAQVVVLGRTGRTERSFIATAGGTVANVALNLALVPAYGIVGAGIALVVSYVIVVGLMYAFTQKLFPVPYEWGRLAQALGIATVLVAGAELLLPDDGVFGLAARIVVWVAFPALLWLTGFLTGDERRAAGLLLHPREVAARLAALAETQPEPGVGSVSEVFEAERSDEDRL